MKPADDYNALTHMAHPVDQRTLREVAHDELHDPDNWVNAFMLLIVIVICVGLIVKT